MKKALIFLIPVLMLAAPGAAENGGPAVNVEVDNDVQANQGQNQSASASGGDSQSDSASASNSNANLSLSTSSTSNYQTRTPPLTMFPPYLPYWTHGGWGTIKAYFPNGPTANDLIYETTFDPDDPDDRRELRGVLKALPHRGLLAALGGALNDVAVALFGKPDTYFYGRGFEIADSIVRDRRPAGKALLVFIDSNVDVALLADEGYAYVGKVSVEGDTDRNWDQAYKAAVAEALLWDVDILLVSGGMKGVTTGTNVSFPSAAGGYSQVNYSLSLLGGTAKGITEGKGKATLSAEAYRHAPQTVERRRIPAAVYDRIRARALPVGVVEPVPTAAPAEPPAPARPEMLGPPRREIFEPVTDVGQPAAAVIAPAPVLAPAMTVGATSPSPAPVATADAAPANPTPATPAGATPAVPAAPASAAPANPAAAATVGAASGQPVARTTATSVSAAVPPRRPPARRPAYQRPGIPISRELFEMAGFPNDQQVGYVNIR
ncbi:MAG: hypothetical protein MUC88_14500 [Planctomycetes bacterium]|jgi:hypothetical protein|nr:hypothetical protein [Planctomycetota bacterium]